MKIKIMLLVITLIGCQNKKEQNLDLIVAKKNKGENSSQTNSLELNFDDNTVYFENVFTTGNTKNINSDYVITYDKKQKVLIEGAFLDSDLLDGKEILFSNKNVSNVKARFYYDIVFTGDEKKTIKLGFTLDTLISLKVRNGKIKVPIFNNIKEKVWQKLKKEMIIEKAYVIGIDYFKKNESDEVYLNYLNKVEDFKNNKYNLKKLEELSFDIDYTKFEVNYENENGINYGINYNRGFNEYNVSNTDNSKTTIIKLKSQLYEYKVLKEVYCDLNKDGYKDLIIIFEPKNLDKNKDLIINSPFYILINDSENSYFNLVNKNIIYTSAFNCPGFGINKLVVKDNYIVLEQNSCDEFDRLVKDYITFKYNYDSKEIILDKYKRSLFERKDNTEFLPYSLLLTTNDFGKVLFENYDSKIEYDKSNIKN